MAERGAWVQQVGGVWVGRWNDPLTGGRKQVALHTLDVTTAADRKRWRDAKAREVAAQRRRWGGTGKTAIDDAVRAYLADCEGRGLRPRTTETYRKGLDLMTKHMNRAGRRHVQEITALDLTSYRDAVVAAPGKASTKRGKLSCVHALAEWLRSRKQVRLTPEEISDALVSPEVPEPAPVILRTPELSALLVGAAVVPAAGELVATTLLSGCRLHELEHLRWDWLDLGAAPELRVPAAVSKTGKARAVDLGVSPMLQDLLRALPRRGPWVFGGAAPLDRNESWRMLSAVRSCVPDVAWHWRALRATCGTWLACAPGIWGAASAFLTAKQLGHSVRISERHYLGVIRGIPAEARSLEDAMGVTWELAALVAGVRGRAGP